MIRAAMLVLVLAGCSSRYEAQHSVGRGPVAEPADVYSRAEVDAINAEVTCRALARTMLQAARCGVRR